MKHVLIAGGLCGATMLVAAEKIRAQCAAREVSTETTIQNLWETSYVRPGYDLIVEMFPFFEHADCPVADGRPFINHVGEAALLEKIAEFLCSEVKR